MKKAFREAVDPGSGDDCGGDGNEYQASQGERQGSSRWAGCLARAEKAVDARGESGLCRGKSGADHANAGILDQPGGADEGFREQQRAGRVSAHGIVIGSPVCDPLPMPLPRIGREPGQKAEGEELPIVVVEGVGSLVIESNPEATGIEAAGFEEIRGYEDGGTEKSDERDGMDWLGEGKDGRRSAGLRYDAPATAAGRGEAQSAQSDAEAAEDRGSKPKTYPGSEHKRKPADGLGSMGRFIEQIFREEESTANQDGDEQRSNLEHIEDAFAAARGDGFKVTGDESGIAGEKKLHESRDDAGDNGKKAEQTQSVRERHRASFSSGLEVRGSGFLA